MNRIILALAMGLLSISAMAQDDPVTRDLGADHFAAGQNVTVSRAVAGDLIAAGREVSIDGEVAGDAVAAGRSVRLNNSVSRNVYAAGAQVFVNGAVSGNARLAGGEVEVAPSARVDGGASIAAGQARVSGSLGSYLQAAVGNLYINGPIAGDVETSAAQIELGPNTRIGGRLLYRSSGQLRRDPEAQVLGGVEQRQVEIGPSAAMFRGLGRALWWIWTLGLMLVATILVAMLPGFFSGVSQTLRVQPGASGLLGLGILVVAPFVCFVLLLTIIGAPLSFLSFAA